MKLKKTIIGTINNSISSKYLNGKYLGRKIVLYSDRLSHFKKHINEYSSIEDYKFTVASINKIINNPDFVFLDENKKGIEFYKNLNTNILVVVRTSNSKELKVRSVYPVKQSKIENRKSKQWLLAIFI